MPFHSTSPLDASQRSGSTPPETPLSGQRSGWERLLDRTVLFSFDRTGFHLHRRHYDSKDVDVSLRGKIALVTGASSGIGLATALGLAQRGAQVWLLCRDRERGRRAVEQLQRESANEQVHLALVDIAEPDGVRRFAEGFEPSRVDILVHNAGLLPRTKLVNSQGLEQTFATHVIGPLVLTWALAPKLSAAPEARVLFVSSGGMYTQRLRLEDLDWRQRPYDGVVAYAQTKRMQVVLAELLAERFADSTVRVNAMHPGWADTKAVRTSLPRFWAVTRRILRSAEQGADTAVWASVCPRLTGESGRFWFDRDARPTHLLPWTRETPGERARFWALCCRTAGLAITDPATPAAFPGQRS
jgi:NAD(P)-dependent dehydrogenase (short-subunit alcohol dehydrogenase family)